MDNVLKIILEKKIQFFYSGELGKVYVHHGSASSHTTRFTPAYAAELRANFGITLVSDKDMPLKSPDISLMDFFGSVYLKRGLFKRRATFIAVLWKLLNEEWDAITPETCKTMYAAWKRRLRMVSKMDGEHIENVKTVQRSKL